MPYDPNFITGNVIPLPTPNDRVRSSAFGGDYIHHLRHSILFNQERGLAFVSANNLDAGALHPSQLTDRSFRNDSLVQPTSLQIDNDRGYRTSQDGVFGPNPWDRGHLTRRKSVSWGSVGDTEIAERETDLWTNVAPQHENLHDDAWGNIEDWMMERVSGERACVFTGPVFTEDDPEHKNGPNELPIRIPAGFWKVITAELNGEMRSAGFLLWQRDYDSSDPLPFSPVLEQVRLTTIEVLTGLTFPALRSFDPLLFRNQQRTPTGAVGNARGTLRARMAGDPQLMSDADLELDTLMEATAPGTAAIASKRDIVL